MLLRDRNVVVYVRRDVIVDRVTRTKGPLSESAHAPLRKLRIGVF